MNPAEVAHRLGERWRQHTQPAFLRGLAKFESEWSPCKAPVLPEKEAAPKELLVRLAKEAEHLQRGSWQLFGWRQVEVGAPPCWSRDPFCGVVINPEKPAHRLNHRSLPDGADARTIWEVNRWAEMTRLAMHGWLNNDVAAVRTAQLWLEDWCDRNPPGLGINWTSPLEVALRLINFTWFDALVAACMDSGGQENPALKNAQHALVRRIVPVHAAWIWRYRSAGSSANNHLLGELAALVVAGSRWPGLSKIACTADAAWDLLGREVLHQFAPDGGSREQALHYHLFAFDLAWQASRAVGCKAGDVHDRLMAAGDYFQALAHGQEPWDFGDNDDAQVVPLTLDRSQAAKEWLAWFRGAESTLSFWQGSFPRAAKVLPARHFHESGMAVVESGGWKARLDASSLGFGALAAHGHGDALHLSLWDGDEALLIDPGTGGYYGHPKLREELASWEAHNGPLPEGGYKTPRRLGAFLWTRHHRRPVLATEGKTIVAIFDHESHSFQRTVRFENDHVQVRDVEGGQKAFTVSLIFSPGCLVKAGGVMQQPGYQITRGSRSWLLQVSTGAAAVVSERQVSPGYGHVENAPVLTLTSLQGELAFTLQRQV